MADHSPAAGSLNCIVVTPEQTVLETTTDFVVVPLFDGEVGIAPLHSPMIGRLGYGELRLGHAPHAKRFYIDGGFVQVLDDTVTVLTGRAIPVEKLDPAAAAEQLRAAQARPANTDDLLAIRDRLIEQSRAQLRLVGAGKTTVAH